MMLRSLFFSAVAGLFLAAPVKAESAFNWNTDGSISIDGMQFRITQMDKNWMSASQNEQTVEWQKKTESGNVRQGVFKARGGLFSLNESVDLSNPNQAKIEITLTSAAGIDCNDISFGTALPVKQFLAAPINFNNVDVRFNTAYDSKAWRVSGEAKNAMVELPLPNGKLVIAGNFIPLLQDNRRFDADFWALRLSFTPNSGLIRQAKLVCTMTFEPFTATPVDLRGVVNMGFADEVAGDRQGGWTDQGPDNDLRMFPAGKQKCAGVDFDIIDPAGNAGKSCIVLRGAERQYFPAATEIILDKPVAAKYLYVLNAVAWEPNKPTEIGEITCEFVTNSYVDRSIKRFPVNSGIDVANFWGPHALRRAVVGWKNSNQSSSVGLYVTRYDLTGEPLKRIAFESRNAAVWMIAGVSLSNSAGDNGETGPFVMKADNEWFPLTNSNAVVKNSILDFSDLLEAPAGKYGFLKNVDGVLEFERRPGVTARFYGANIAFEPNFMEHKWSDRMVDEFAALGYNIARLHHFDMKLAQRTGKSSTELEPVRLERMDYLVNAFKAKGIYITIDLFTLRTLIKGEIPEFPDLEITPQDFKALAFINDNVMKNWETFSSNLLNHVNPYTGIAWKDDPAIVSISLINEDTIFSTAVRTPFIRRLYEKKFEAYVKQHAIQLTDRNRENHWNRFLSEVYLQAFLRMRAFMEKQGVKAQITDQNFWGNIATTILRQNYDLVDNHFYWGHPVFLGKSWNLPLSVINDDPIAGYAGGINGMFPTRLAGKPFSVTEWDFVNPNEFSVGGAFLMGAYSALQDWSILCRFAYSHTDTKVMQENTAIGLFDVVNDPLRLLSERAGALFFLRRDVKPSAIWYPFLVSTRHFETTGAPDNYPTAIMRLGLIGKTGSILAEPGKVPELPAGTRAVMGFDKSWSLPVPYISATDTYGTLRQILTAGATTSEYLDLEHNRFVSSTGELTLDRDNGTFLVKTAASEAFLLKVNQALDGAFASVKNRLAPAAFLVAARDGKPLANSSRILLLHLTDTKNTGLTFQDSAHTTVLDWGKTPLLIRRGAAEITLRRDLTGFRLHALGFDGRRRVELPIRSGKSSSAFNLDTICNGEVFAAYELVKE